MFRLSRPPPPPIQSKECPICRDELPLAVFPAQPPTSQCQHGPAVCPPCLTAHITSEINMQKGDTVRVVCPLSNCRANFEYDEVKQWADGAIFERYDNLLLRKQLQKDPHFMWCKTATCGSGQIHEGGSDANIVTCAACGHKSCFIHDVPWHSGVTCEDFDKVLAADSGEAATRAYYARKTKPCPQCAARIEKNEGCDHMTCRPPGGCGHEFCWSCLADYSPILREGNHHHRQTCQYYTAYREVGGTARIPLQNFFRRLADNR